MKRIEKILLAIAALYLIFQISRIFIDYERLGLDIEYINNLPSKLKTLFE